MSRWGTAKAAPVVIGTALTGWSWQPVFSDAGFLFPLASAIGLAAAAEAVALHRRQSWWRSLALALALAGFALLLWYRIDVRGALSDLSGSWKGLASTGLYAPTSRPYVLVPAAVAGSATWLGIRLAFRARSPVASLGPIVAAQVIATMYTADLRTPPPAYLAAFSVVVAAIVILGAALPVAPTSSTMLMTVGGGPPSTPGRALSMTARPLAAGLLLVAGVTGMAVTLGPGTAPFSLRSRLSRPLDISVEQTPMIEVKQGLLAANPAPVFAIEVEQAESGFSIDRLAAVFLDRYDGTFWYSSDRYEAAGQRLPAPEQWIAGASPGADVVFEMTPTYPFSTLPTPGRIAENDGSGLGWNRATGLLIAPGPSTERRVELRVEAVSPTEREPTFSTAPPKGSGSELPELTTTQRDIFERFLRDATAGATNTSGQLAALETALLSDRFAYNPQAPAGHNLAALSSYLDRSTASEPGVGFAEQSAAAFAVLARMLGLSSRLVIGYVLDDPITADTVPSSATITEDQIHVWPEVWSDQGWVRFDPSSRAHVTTADATRTKSLSVSPNGPVGVAPASTFDDPVFIEDPLDPESSNRLGRYLPWLAVFAVHPVGVTAVRTSRRLVRRYRGTPVDRIVGASLHTVEAFTALGLIPAQGVRSTRELAAAVPADASDRLRLLGAIETLADGVDQALYAPASPGQELVAPAWNSARVAVRGVHRASSRRARLVAFLLPRRRRRAVRSAGRQRSTASGPTPAASP